MRLVSRLCSNAVWLILISAALAFGFTEPALIDDFNRANEGPPPSANWTSHINPAENPVLCTISSELRRCPSPTGVHASAWWNAATFGPDMAIALRLSDGTSASGHLILLHVRLLGPGTSGTDGYNCEFRPDNDLVWIVRLTNNLGTPLVGPNVAAMTTGDEIACEVIGSTITAYVNQGSGWVAVATVNDTTYPGSGFVGVGTNTTGYGMDDVRAGTIAAGAPGRRGVPLFTQ